MTEPRNGLDGVTATSAFRATVAVTVIMFLSHILGLFRESAMAATFGVGFATDAYFVAFMVPNGIAAILAGGIQTVGTSLLGDYVYRESGREELPVVVWSLFHLILIVVSAVTAALMLTVPPCLPHLAPGFTPEQNALARQLTLIMSGIVLVTGINAWCQSVLQAYQRFNPPAYGHITFNIVMIAAILMSGMIGGIVGLAWGILAAFVSMTLVQFPAAVGLVPAYRCVLDTRHPCVRKMAVQMIPVSVRSVAVTLNSVVERYLASKLISGSISALEYANRAIQIPINIFGSPVVIVLYSAMSAFRSGGDTDRYKRAFVRGLRMIAFCFVPLSVGLIVLSEDLIRLLFERGAFDPSATDLTKPALIFFSVGLLFTIWRSHAIQALSALQDFTGALNATLAAVAVNVAVNFALVGPMAHGGIALGKSIGDAACFAVLYWMIRRRVGPLGGVALMRSTLKILTAAAAAGACVLFLGNWNALDPVWSGAASWGAREFGRAWSVGAASASRLTVLGGAYVGLFALFGKVVGVSEAGELYELIRTYLAAKSGQPPSQPPQGR